MGERKNDEEKRRKEYSYERKGKRSRTNVKLAMLEGGKKKESSQHMGRNIETKKKEIRNNKTHPNRPKAR